MSPTRWEPTGASPWTNVRERLAEVGGFSRRVTQPLLVAAMTPPTTGFRCGCGDRWGVKKTEEEKRSIRRTVEI